MIEVILLIVSYLAKKAFALIFLLIGLIVSSFKWELRKYLKEVAIVNDVYLNVIGQHSLNGVLSSNGKGFGNRLQTISCAMYLIKLTKFGNESSEGLSKLEKGHIKIAYEAHKQNIINEYNNLMNGKV